MCCMINVLLCCVVLCCVVLCCVVLCCVVNALCIKPTLCFNNELGSAMLC